MDNTLPQKISCKVSFRNDLRRFTISTSTTFETLISFLNKAYRSFGLPSNWFLQYIDIDGDKISITSEIEFQEAVFLYFENKLPVFRLFIQETDVPVGSSHTIKSSESPGEIEKSLILSMSQLMNSKNTTHLSPNYQLTPSLHSNSVSTSFPHYTYHSSETHNQNDKQTSGLYPSNPPFSNQGSPPSFQDNHQKQWMDNIPSTPTNYSPNDASLWNNSSTYPSYFDFPFPPMEGLSPQQFNTPPPPHYSSFEKINGSDLSSCLVSEFSHLKIAIKPGQTEVRNFTFRNNGNTEWPLGCALVQISGEPIKCNSAELSNIKAGETINVSLRFEAPNQSQKYKLSFSLRSPTRILFGDIIVIELYVSDTVFSGEEENEWDSVPLKYQPVVRNLLQSFSHFSPSLVFNVLRESEFDQKKTGQTLREIKK